MHRLFDLNELIIRILHGRGYDTPEKIEAFLYPRTFRNSQPVPDAMGCMKPLNLMKKAIGNDWKIGIFADSDLDGITSLSVVHLLALTHEDRILYQVS